MQSQARRDEKTLQICTALAVFVGLTTVGSVLLALGHRALGVGEPVTGALFPVLLAAAALMGARPLLRGRRRG